MIPLPETTVADSARPVKVVLDTNVVIDWLVFDDPFMKPFRDGVSVGDVVVLTHQPAYVELVRVLTYRELKLDERRQRDVLARFEAGTLRVAVTDYAVPSDEPLPRGFPRCRDPDDDPFLALAYRTGARALVSRDNAVLKLARRCRKFGFEIWTVSDLIAAIDARRRTHDATLL